MNKNILLLVPTDAWETLHETLLTATRSSAFDPNLRKEIKEALDQVRPITAKVGTLLDVAEEVPRCAHITTGAGKAHLIGDNRINQLQRALAFFRSNFAMNGGRRDYSKQLV